MPLGNHLGQIAIGRGDKPDVDRNGAIPAQPLNLSLLQGAQELGLQVERQLAHFIEKERSLVRKFETPHLSCNRASECAFLVAEELAFQQPGGNSGAIHLHKRVLAPVAEAVNRAGKQFLAGSGFALDQNRGICRSNRLDLFENLAQASAFAHNIFKSVFEIDLFFEILLLLPKPVTEFCDLAENHGIADGHRHLVRNLHQHLRLALRERIFHATGNGKNPKSLIAVNERHAVRGLHSQPGQVANPLFRKPGAFDAAKKDRFPSSERPPRRRTFHENTNLCLPRLVLSEPEELHQQVVGPLVIKAECRPIQR